MLLLLFMHSNQYFLRSVKSNMNDNLIALAENNSSTQTHLQAQSADEIPVSSASILPTTTSQVFSTPLSSSTSVHQSLLQNTQPPTIIIQNSPQLQFDPSHIDMFFHTFDAHYFGKHLTEEQLYFELIKCLSSEHFHKASLCMSRDSVNSYTTLKAALIKAYSLPLHKRLTQLRTAPPLGDRSPTQLLYELKNILGTIDPQDETLNWFLQTEFMNRLPNNIQFILAAFPFKSVEELAPIADSLIQNDKSLNSPKVNSTDDVFSAMLKEFSSLKFWLCVKFLTKLPHLISLTHHTIDLTPSLLMKTLKIISQLHPNNYHFLLLCNHHQVRISLFQVEIRFLMVCVFTTKNMELLPDTVSKAALILIAI